MRSIKNKGVISKINKKTLNNFSNNNKDEIFIKSLVKFDTHRSNSNNILEDNKISLIKKNIDYNMRTEYMINKYKNKLSNYNNYTSIQFNNNNINIINSNSNTINNNTNDIFMNLNSNPYTPYQIDTNKFGEIWENSPDEDSFEMNININTPQQFHEIIKNKGNFCAIEIINNEAISSANYKNQIALVHATINPGHVDLLVKCQNKQLNNEVANYVINLFK
jgi:hypothetical protein